MKGRAKPVSSGFSRASTQALRGVPALAAVAASPRTMRWLEVQEMPSRASAPWSACGAVGLPAGYGTASTMSRVKLPQSWPAICRSMPYGRCPCMPRLVGPLGFEPRTT
jgi:hypothetical protein